MNIFYRILGMTAALCTRMSRIRVNGVPSHIAILFLLTVVTTITATDYLAVRTKDFGKPPTAYASVGEALSKMQSGRYVSIAGLIAPDVQIHASGASSSTYGLLYDPGTTRAILVEGCPVHTGYTVLKGMVNCVPADFPMSRGPAGYQVAGYTMSPAFRLDTTDGPSDPRIVGSIVGVLSALILLCSTSILLKHLIFQPVTTKTRVRDAAPAQTNTISNMRYSGQLMVSAKSGRGFLAIPAALSSVKAGDLAFITNIIDSNVTNAWVSVMQTGSLAHIESGLQYVGLSVRPALRLRYTDIALPSAKRVTSIVSFATEEERDQAREIIEQASKQKAFA